MDASPRHCSRAAAPFGRLVALLAASAFVIAALTGNAFSMHVGMTATASEAAVADHDSPDVLAAAGPAIEVVAQAVQEATAPLRVGSDAQHLMHLLGACLAVLAGAALLLCLGWLVRGLAGGLPVAALLFRLPVPSPTGSWSPPPPCPPTSSPVIRT